MSFVELALQAEQLCKAGQLESGITVFKTALQKGTNDPEIRAAVYSQIGNAYFYLKDYSYAREFHEKELDLALEMKDQKCRANALGNLGNTLRSLGLYQEANEKCQIQLQIWREIGNRNGEARALYNLGNIFHAQAKSVDSSSTLEGQYALGEAIRYYECYLAIVKAIDDRVLMGRAYGNLGNAHYRLGSFETAIECHLERLKIAEQHNDTAAQRRAYTNLGNANVFLANYIVSVDYYEKVRNIARSMNDECIEAQALYSLGATTALMNNPRDAISYYLDHLKIAQKLKDIVGESRAYWALGNAHRQLGNKERAAFYTRRHLEISREVGDEDGINSAEETLLRLETASEAPSSPCHSLLRRRRSMEHLDMHVTAKAKRKDRRNPFSSFFSKDKEKKIVDPNKENEEDLFDILTRVQGSRINDQRAAKTDCSRKDDIENLLNEISGVNGANRRMFSQRVSLSEINDSISKSVNQSQSDSNLQKLKKEKKSKKAKNFPDDDFFESLMSSQGRLDEQRSSIKPGKKAKGPQLRTIPDDDFFKKLLAN